jgi:endonuclease/exonuclease/phosphatase family metal-dependent hydrolase
MKRLFRLFLVGLFFLGLFSAPAAAGGDIIKVMTRNQYLGADLTPLVTAGSPGDFYNEAIIALQQIAINNFPLRARRLATEVALTEPHVIALQEVFDFKVNNANPGPPFVDHLAETIAALAARGQYYVAAAAVEHLDIAISLPFDVTGDDDPDDVRVLDRDVILVREGVTWENLTGSKTICGVPVPNPAPVLPFPVTLQSIPSQEGCNYTIAASVVSPVGPITIERGFVGVDITEGGKTYRVVNTHLEVREPIPGDPSSRILQFLQSVELAGTLLATTPPDRTLILLGDFNSSDEDVPVDSIFPPYQVIIEAGFLDAWDTNLFALFDPGYTCCQEGDLSNRRSLLDERIDIIFVRDTPFRPWAFVMGRVPIFPLIFPPNWASDHGGVFAQLFFR